MVFGRIDIQLLGGVEVTIDGVPAPAGSPLQRVLLAALAVDTGRTVSVDELVDRMWDDGPPRTAAKSIQKYVWRLRGVLGPQALVRHDPGYRLDVAPAAVDLMRLEDALAEAGRLDDPALRYDGIATALEGADQRPLDGIESRFAVQERARLEELCLVARETRLLAGIDIGRHREVVTEAMALTAAHPYREELWRILMLGLYRSGRQADALRAFGRVRDLLADDLGIEPNPALARLEHQILVQDPSLEPTAPVPTSAVAPEVVPPPVAAGGDAPVEVDEVRTVTVVAAGTASDRIEEVADRFGGQVLEPDADGATLVVFGVPGGEEDHLRAASAALALHRIGIGPIAVATGPATVRSAAPPRPGRPLSATGEVIERVLRSVGRAGPSGPVVDWDTVRLLGGGAVMVNGPEDELVLVELHERDRSRPHGAPFVGRKRELAQLVGLWEDCRATGTGQVAVVIGDAGIGKTRLLAEFRAEPGAPVPTWLQITCRPEGEEAYTPIIRLHRDALGPDPLSEVRATLSERGVAPAEAAWLLNHLAPLYDPAGPAGPDGPANPDESLRAWARALELGLDPEGAVVAIDDAHDAPAALWDFVDLLLDGAEVPVLVLAGARPEPPVDPPWLRIGAPLSTIRLGGLARDDSCRLAAALLEPVGANDPVDAETVDELAGRLSDRAQGNPLFLHELARQVVDTGHSGEAPDTIRQVVTAHIDRAGDRARLALQTVAVIGGPVRAELVAAAAGLPEPAVGSAIAELRRRHLLTGAPGQPSGHQVAHPLVGEVAVEQVPPGRRLGLHDRTAAWLAARPDAHTLEILDRVTHHAGEAFRLARGLDRAEAPDLGRRWARVALEFGQRLEPIDSQRCRQILVEAMHSLDPDSADWGRAAFRAGRVSVDLGEWDDGERLLSAAAATAARHGDHRAEALALVGLANLRRVRGEGRDRDEILRAIALVEHDPGPELATAVSWHLAAVAVAGEAAEAIELGARWAEVCERHGTAEARVRLRHALGLTRLDQGDPSGLAELRDVLTLCLDTGLTRQATSVFNNLGYNSWFYDGPEPAIAIIEEGIEFATSRRHDYQVEFMTCTLLEVLYDAGQWDRLLERSDWLVRAEDGRGWSQVQDVAASQVGQVELWRGQLDRAAVSLSPIRVERARANGDLQEIAPWLVLGALGRLAAGRPDEAAALAIELGTATAGHDRWRCSDLHNAVRVLVTLGRFDDAAALLVDQPLGMTRPELVRRTARAVVDEATGPAEQALTATMELHRRWERFGSPLEAGLAALAAARLAARLGRDAEAERWRTIGSERLIPLGVDPGTCWWQGPPISSVAPSPAAGR